MTTKDDWQFRGDYLRDAAARCEQAARALMQRAEDYRRLADAAERNIAIITHASSQTAQRERAMQELADQAQELKMGYE